MISALEAESQKIFDEDIAVCRKIGENGAPLLFDGCTVLTHCNAGSLCAVEYGTALAPIYIATEQEKKIKVFADETRPLLQGARLTAFELCEKGIDTTVICDNMAASLMQSKKIDAVIVGCDRVAANGDFANKIGTLSLAVNAKHFGIPFYVAAPYSTIDFNTPSGAEIVVEERDGKEISEYWYSKRMTPNTAKEYNPAFDVTPNELVTSYITEKGILEHIKIDI
ncbi:MAG: S-methyl-5-thioribose-1-phosphate isomerase [Clostridia bacterium]